MAYPKYTHEGVVVPSLQIRNFNVAVKNVLVETAMVRGVTLKEAFEESLLLWFKRNGVKAPDFQGRERARNALKELLRIRRKERKEREHGKG